MLFNFSGYATAIEVLGPKLYCKTNKISVVNSALSLFPKLNGCFSVTSSYKLSSLNCIPFLSYREWSL